MAAARSVRPRRIVLVGDKDTGKHCYIRRLIENKYPRDSWTNKECDTWPFSFRVNETTEASLQIFLIRGADRGKTVLKKYYQNIDGYIVMFDVTNPESYDNVVGWKKNIDAENKLHDLPCILIASKCDLETDPEVAEQMKGIDILCEFLHFRAHFETSSRDNINIQESFERLIREVLGNPNAPHASQNGSLSSSPPVTRSSSHSDSNEPSSLASEPIHPPLPSPPIPEEYKLKIVVIGERGAGKSAIIQRYVRNTFSQHYVATIGSDIGFKKVVYNQDVLNIQIWDVAGDERFGGMTHLFYRDTDACMVVFDESRYQTLNGAIRWKGDFDLKANYDEQHPKPCILVGNKCDLPKDGQIQDPAHLTEFCQHHKFSRWFETSAKTNVNIGDAFAFLLNEIMAQKLGRDGRRQTSAVNNVILSVDQSRSSTVKSSRHCC